MPSEKTKEITVSMESQRFPRTMVFNRFGIEPSGPFRIIYFALLDADENVRDAYACAIDEDTIQRQREELLDYVARAGTSTPSETTLWRPKASTITSVDVANVIRGARTDATSEIRLYNYSTGDVIDAQRQGKTSVEGAPVALLRCEEGLQRAMFLSIYAADPKS
ncbi:MAG: hypothetical protein DLM73_17625 [Chthoniobacterales bacterium]|nr:MAG: hypothetical protein DLM73_17625 [Chthoniobacterales bacterium]